MTQLKPLFAVVFIFLSFSFNAFANAGIGYEISYQQVDSLKYDVDFVVYRYCGGVKLNTNFTTPYVVCQTSGYKKSLTWKIVSINEIKTQCDSIGGRCQPPNSSFTGAGYERIVLRSTVDFKLSAFDSFYNAGCKSVRFEMDDCCRSSGINTGLSSKRMYTYAELNLAFDNGNSSPTFTSPPMISTCCNQPVYYDIGAVDFSDNDSLSFAFAEPMSAFGTGISYSGLYKYDFPIDCYFPGPLKPPYNNPGANPPIGMYLNSGTGEMAFTPVKCSERTVFVIEVTEWRKDAQTGKMVVVGKSRRDIEIQQKICGSNYPPVIESDAFKYRACEGEELCFNITSSDRAKVPPPPNPKPKGDSVFLNWNRGISKAKFTITKDTFESAKFCWTPDSGMSRTNPYTFIVYADDDRCGDVLKTQRTFKIWVNPKAPSFTLRYDSIGCGRYKIDNSLSAAQLNQYRFQLKIKAITGAGLKAYLLSTNRDSSNNPEDVLKFTRNGSYELTYTTECGTTIFDTLHITDFPDVPVFKDIEVCYDHGNIDLYQFDTFNKGGKWTCPQEPRLVNSKNEFLTDSIGARNSVQSRVIYYSVGGSSGSCGLVDSIKIRVNPLPKVALRDGIFCQNEDTINLKQDKIILQPGGATINLGRQKWSCVDCQTYNESDIIEDLGSGLPGALQDFILHIDTSVIDLKTKSSDTLLFELEFKNVFGCYNRDTTRIVVNKTPELSSNGLSDICWNAGVVNLSNLANLNLRGGTWQAIPKTGSANDSLFNLQLSDSIFNTLALGNGIKNSDSAYRLQYTYSKDFCSVNLELPLVIRKVDVPEINRSVFQAVHSSFPPYGFCILDLPVTMTATNSGVWSSSDTNAVTNNVFDPRKATKLNEVFAIRNTRTGGNCSATDSVLVIVNPQPTLKLNNDTAITWYASNMKMRVKAEFKHTTGVLWLPLTGGSVDNSTAQEVDWTFTANKDSVTRKLLYASTVPNKDNVCPFVEKTMLVTVYPTPCMDVWMTFDKDKKTLVLSPSNTTLPYYFWKVNGKTSTRLNPSFDLSNSMDSVVLVTLKATNQLGDTCLSYNKINVNNGSVQDVSQVISLYPNPVTSGFSILTPKPGSIVDLKLYNALGSEVLNYVVDENYVDCSNLSSGIYSVVVTVGQEVYVTKFVKKR